MENNPASLLFVSVATGYYDVATKYVYKLSALPFLSSVGQLLQLFEFFTDKVIVLIKV